MQPERAVDLLPWRWPFLMLDGLLDCVPHERIRTKKLVTASDPVVSREGEPGWFPALLLLEGMSQSAALLYRLSYGEQESGRMPLLGFLRASLQGSACAGEALVFEVDAVKMTRRGGLFEARALCGERLVAQAELAFSAAGNERETEHG